MSTPIKIGSILAALDHGRSDVTKPQHWRSATVTGETKQSWLVEEVAWQKTKINKKTLKETIPNYAPRQWYTLEGREDAVWLAENRHEIADRVQRCQNPALLRQILSLLDQVKNASA